jgi:DNA-binding LacI/PurR family transcriptional regulator
MKALPKETVELIREAIKNEQSGMDIARRFGISKSTVSRIAGGSRHGRRLSKSEKADIRLARFNGECLKVIAARHGIAMSTASRICNEFKIATLMHGGVRNAAEAARPA